MRRTTLLTTLLFAMFFATKITYAQPMMNGGMRAAFTDQEFRLQLRDDLELTDDQAIKMRDIGDEFRKEMEQMFRENGPQMFSKEDREEAIDKMRTEGFKKGEALKEKFRNVLTEKQFDKLQERTYQMTGGLQSSLFSVGFLDTLKLTPEQVKKIEVLQKKMTTEALALLDKMQGASSDERAKIMQELQTLGQKFSKMVEEILTDEQKTKAERLKEETPDYIWKKLPENRNKTREWRPGRNSWQPGQGVPEGMQNPNKEAKPVHERSEKPFPGQN